MKLCIFIGQLFIAALFGLKSALMKSAETMDPLSPLNNTDYSNNVSLSTSDWLIPSSSQMETSTTNSSGSVTISPLSPSPCGKTYRLGIGEEEHININYSQTFLNSYTTFGKCIIGFETSYSLRLKIHFIQFHTMRYHENVTIYGANSLAKSTELFQFSGTLSDVFDVLTANNYMTLGISHQLKGYFRAVVSVSIESNTGSHTLVNGQGLIMSPYYPMQYRNNERTEWKITADPGYIIKLKFLFFSTEDNDLVSIYDGSGSEEQLLKRLSGSKISVDPIYSTSNHMTVKFPSDRWKTDKGFLAHYQQIPIVYTTQSNTQNFQGCWAHYTLYHIGQKVKIHSPNYELWKQFRYRQCRWGFTAAIGYQLNIHFTTVDIGPNDTVLIYDSKSLLNRFYSGNAHDVLTRDNHMNVDLFISPNRKHYPNVSATVSIYSDSTRTEKERLVVVTSIILLALILLGIILIAVLLKAKVSWRWGRTCGRRRAQNDPEIENNPGFRRQRSIPPAYENVAFAGSEPDFITEFPSVHGHELPPLPSYEKALTMSTTSVGMVEQPTTGLPEIQNTDAQSNRQNTE